MGATTIHIPTALLELVDLRARALGVSRNRVILDAIEASLAPRKAWSPELLAMLVEPLDKRTGDLLEDSLRVVRKSRLSRRRPPKL